MLPSVLEAFVSFVAESNKLHFPLRVRTEPVYVVDDMMLAMTLNLDVAMLESQCMG